MIFLSESDVLELVEPARLVEAIARGFRSLDGGGVDEPRAVRLNGLGDGAGYLTVFPAHDGATALASAKVLAGNPGNPTRGRPEIDAIVVLADTRTGAIEAIVSARNLTALRTAATSALAIGLLRPGDGPALTGLVGVGSQSRMHARVLAATGLARGFLVASPSGGLERAEPFARAVAAETGLATEAVTPEAIAALAEVIVTATLSRRPVLSVSPRPDAVLACVGPFLPAGHEVDPALCAVASLVVSDHPARFLEQWRGGAAAVNGLGERLVGLADLVSGRRAVTGGGLRLFFSDGRGFQDNVAAGQVLAAAKAMGRGQVLSRD